MNNDDLSAFFPSSLKNFEVNPDLYEHLIRDPKLADYQYEIIMNAISDFEKELDDNLEVAVQLAAFGQSVVMQVIGLGYSNPSLIHFYGFVNGSKSELIQNITQLNFLILAVPKTEPNRPARRIGFTQEEPTSPKD